MYLHLREGLDDVAEVYKSAKGLEALLRREPKGAFNQLEPVKVAIQKSRDEDKAWAQHERAA